MKTGFYWLILRIMMGFIFLWSALDSLFGLGFPAEEGWLTHGASPTFGYLNFATYGPFATFFQGLAGNPLVDLLFVGGQLLIGLALLLGIGVKIAAFSGALQMLLIYFSAFPYENNPLIDSHIIYIVILIGIAAAMPVQLSLHNWWKDQPMVQRMPILE